MIQQSFMHYQQTQTGGFFLRSVAAGEYVTEDKDDVEKLLWDMREPEMALALYHTFEQIQSDERYLDAALQYIATHRAHVSQEQMFDLMEHLNPSQKCNFFRFTGIGTNACT